ncbi:MAG: hypothetical protein IT328_19955 [Caldilineaceae bacterium]|nr:hypothetical protein [Caldilineaceae bacterium]
MEQDVKAAARRLIARMSQMATREDEPAADVVHYQSLLAQLALAQLALTYPQAVLGPCVADGTPMHFVAGEDGLYVRCSADPSHGFKVASL